jgi:hypothetical protein
MAFEFPRKRSLFREWIDQRNKEVEKVTQLREQYYPLIEKQLELLWKDMRDGKIPGKDGDFYKAIAEVRKAFPHPEWKDEIMTYDFSKEVFEEDLD